jgi:hypothetical protein
LNWEATSLVLVVVHIPSLNTCIEYNGIQHYEASFGEESFRRTKISDKIKLKFCKDNNINFIRIPYTIKNIERYLLKRMYNMV